MGGLIFKDTRPIHVANNCLGFMIWFLAVTIRRSHGKYFHSYVHSA